MSNHTPHIEANGQDELLTMEDVNKMSVEQIEQLMLSRIRDLQYLFNEMCVKGGKFKYESDAKHMGHPQMRFALLMKTYVEL